MRTIALIALLAAGSAFGVQITVTPTLGPDFGFGAYSSPNFNDWAVNVVNGMIAGTTPGSGVTQYVPLSNGASLTGAEFISTPFQSWQGVAPGPYAGEQGTALYFSLKVVAGPDETFQITDLAAQETYLGQSQLPWIPGDFTDFSAYMVGLKSGGGYTTSADPSSTLLTELYYVGLGFVQPMIAGSGSQQDQINATVAAVQALANKTTQVCYSIGDSSNCGSVNIQATGVPEPGTLALLGLGLAGVAFLRRRSA